MTKEGDTLCQFSKGEERGVYLLVQLLSFTPEKLKEEVQRQIKDEQRHHEVFSGRLKHLDIDCEGMKKDIELLYDLAQECVDRKDWAECMAIQTIIEEFAMASFGHAINNFDLDEETKEIIKGVVADERRHLAFGMSQLTSLVRDPEHLEKIKNIQNKVIELISRKALSIELSEADRADRIAILSKAYLAHKARCRGIGLELAEAGFV